MDSEKIYKKLENIENILKMMLIDSVINETENSLMIKNLLSEIRNILEPMGMENIRINSLETKNYVFANMESNNLKKIRKIYGLASEVIGDIKLVLVFEKISNRRRKAFDDSCISYYISESGEMRIF